MVPTYVTRSHCSLRVFSKYIQIGFLVLTCIGVLIPMFMVNPKHMVRSDGTKVHQPKNPSWKSELLGLVIAIRDDPWIILLFPMFFTSNWFYTWRKWAVSPLMSTLTVFYIGLVVRAACLLSYSSVGSGAKTQSSTTSTVPFSTSVRAR